MKEYVIKCTLDQLDLDLKQIMFKLQPFKRTQSFVVKGLEELLSQYEESQIKIISLKNNSYSGHHMDRIVRIEKDIIVIVQVLDEW